MKPPSISKRRFSWRAWIPQDRFYWTGIVVLGALDVIMCKSMAIQFTGIFAALSLVIFFLLFRGIYVIVRPGSGELHIAMESFAAVISYAVVAVPLSYVAGRSGYPEFDPVLRATDLALGFDWDAWAGFLSQHAWLRGCLGVAYRSILYQPILTLLILPVVKGGQRGLSFMRAILFAIIMEVVVFWFFPAAMGPAKAASWYPAYEALRGPGALSFTLGGAGGIVSFPSFHAAISVMFAYSVRGLGVITALLWTFNLMMLIATPYFGYHYLTDVIAGIGVAVVSIVAAHLADRYFPPQPTRF